MKSVHGLHREELPVGHTFNIGATVIVKMMTEYRNRQLDFPASSHQDSSRDIPEMDPDRGHLTPPCDQSKNRAYGGGRYPSQSMAAGNWYEDTSNYGSGGYYGTTYHQPFHRRGSMMMFAQKGRPDDIEGSAIAAGVTKAYRGSANALTGRVTGTLQHASPPQTTRERVPAAGAGQMNVF